MITDKISAEVAELLKGDDGHGFDHVARVRNMAIQFAEQEEADVEIVELAALLHDVDDYKLVGEASAKELPNATALLDKYGVDATVQQRVLEIIHTMGYSKYLEDIRPKTLEGMIVSDADMCDAIGAEGIVRICAYTISKGKLFFDKNQSPRNTVISATTYREDKMSHSVQNFFDKLLLIPSITMTSAGKDEASKREKIMIDFLEELFRENQSQEWHEHLINFKNSKQ